MRAGQDAALHFRWEEAQRSFEQVLTQGEDLQAVEGLAQVAAMQGEVEQALALRERAYSICRRRGDRRRAGWLALHLAIDHAGYRGYGAVANGWLRRAKRLLEGGDPTPEHAWLLLWEGHLAFLYEDDLEQGRRLAQEGLALARRLGAGEAELFGISLEGIAKVAAGEVSEGMSQLDEAAVAALAGEIESLEAASQAYCQLLHACEQVQDLERAAQWCGRLTNYYRQQRRPRFFEYCRLHHAAIFLARGDWQEAEEQLTESARGFESFAPVKLPEVTAKLAELRRRQGDWEEALELFHRAEAHPGASLGRAALAIDQGDPELALDLLQRYFRRLPAGDRIQRSAGLALQVHALVAAGRCGEATAPLAELRELAELVGTTALRGERLAAEGVVAASRGEHAAARDAFEDAVAEFGRCGAPFEAARARLALLAPLAALGRSDLARQEAESAIAALDRLGARRESARARGLLERLPAAEASARTKAPGGLTPRQVEVLQLLALGLSNREIGERLFVSELTVKRHVADILNRLDLPTRAAAAAYAARHGVSSPAPSS